MAFVSVRRVPAIARPAVLACVCAIAASATSGCANGNLSLGNVQTGSAPAAQIVEAKGARKIGEFKLVSVAPIVLTPTNSAAAVQMQDQILRDLNALATRHNFALITGGGGGEPLTLRGYVLATPDRKGIKITQIWDVTDQSGARVNRTVREQIVAASAAGAPDLWTAAGRVDTTGMAEMAVDALHGATPQPPSGIGTVAAPAPVAPPAPGAGPEILAPPLGSPVGNMATGVGATRPRR